MPASTVSYRYFVLGLLAQQPMSGYDINRYLKSLSWLIGTPSFGGLYPALHDLLEEGLVAVEVSQGGNRPPRKTYSISDAGRQALDEWIQLPPALAAPLKDFVMRLILSGNDSDAGLIDRLRQRKAQVAGHRDALAQLAARPARTTEDGLRLAFDYGAALADAELAWLDRMLERLSVCRPAATPARRPGRGRAAARAHAAPHAVDRRQGRAL